MNIGCDIVKNDRIKKENMNFIKKILTQKEIDILNQLKESEKKLFIAGRFAAKEAIIKVLNKNINMQEISILKNKDGSPIALIEKPYQIKISISHEKEHTIAVALLIN